jgi:hypothetical protein
MIRIIAEGAALFALPFFLFALYLAIRGANPLQLATWPKGAFTWNLIAAIVICIGAIGFVGADRVLQRGEYVPASVDKDGNFIPGHFRRP